MKEMQKYMKESICSCFFNYVSKDLTMHKNPQSSDDDLISNLLRWTVRLIDKLIIFQVPS